MEDRRWRIEDGEGFNGLVNSKGCWLKFDELADMAVRAPKVRK
jgi:hypothetical protein